MNKLPTGPIVIGMVIIGLVGCLASLRPKPPTASDNLVVIKAAPTARAAVMMNRTIGAGTAQPARELAPGEDPPVKREPGAINYADKGVLPAL